MLHVGVGVILRSCGGVGSLHVVCKELQTLQSLTVFGVLLAVEHERFCHFVVALAHESLFHLVLYFFYLDALVNVDVAYDFRHCAEVGSCTNTIERLDDGVHYLVERESVFRTVAFGNGKVLHFHSLHFIFELLFL